ncbi:MAG: TFIIB-type zinc finger domain-containing protein [Methanobrevibacter sp.]|nr:TFIIB-type zinc finger domain-containing protein [Methanobrevibacter sp.]
MKKLACEMCGSTNVVKEDGLFTCQSCGAKYSPEEAKKMMVEGTVQIDHSSKIENYEKLLKKGIEHQRWKDVKRYSDELLSIEIENPDAIFYKGLAECWLSSMMDYKDRYDVSKAFNYAIDVMKEKKIDEIGEAIVRYSKEIIPLINSIQNASVNIHNREQKNSYHYINGSDVRKDAKIFYLENLFVSNELVTQVINFYNEYLEDVKKASSHFDSDLLEFLMVKNFLLDEIIKTVRPSEKQSFKAERLRNIKEIKKYDKNFVQKKKVSGGSLFLTILFVLFMIIIFNIWGVLLTLFILLGLYVFKKELLGEFFYQS